VRIVDAHVHLPGKLLGAAPKPIDELRREFENDGLAAAWIMTTDGLIRDTARNNDILAEAVSQHLDFFFPFCTVDPHEGEQEAIRELERARRDLGMRGLKLHPWLQSFSLAHPAIPAILQRAGELGMPVLFHDGTPPYSSPLQIAAAAEKAPGTAVILGHAGLDDLYGDAILACLRSPNIYLCCCSLSCGHIGEIIRRCPPEKLLFGSDGGFGSGIVASAIDKIRAVCDDEDILQAIFWQNPERLLG